MVRKDKAIDIHFGGEKRKKKQQYLPFVEATPRYGYNLHIGLLASTRAGT